MGGAYYNEQDEIMSFEHVLLDDQDLHESEDLPTRSSCTQSNEMAGTPLASGLIQTPQRGQKRLAGISEEWVGDCDGEWYRCMKNYAI